jgi:hypothetical protein
MATTACLSDTPDHILFVVGYEKSRNVVLSKKYDDNGTATHENTAGVYTLFDLASPYDPYDHYRVSGMNENMHE